MLAVRDLFFYNFLMNTSTEVTAEIALAFRDGRIVGEDRFANLSPDDVLALDMQEGTLTLRSGDTSCQLGDVLLNLISVVCVDTPNLLEEGEQASFGAYSSELAVTFVPSDDTVSVIDEGSPPCELPKVPLIQALKRASQRYRVLVAQLWPDAPQSVLDGFSS